MSTSTLAAIWHVDHLEQLVDGDRSVTIVALHPTAVLLGAARLLTYDDVEGMVLVDLFVCETWRRRGVGTALVQHAMDYAHDERQRLTLHVHKDLTAARALYRGLGWKKIDDDPDDPETIWLRAPR